MNERRDANTDHYVRPSGEGLLPQSDRVVLDGNRKQAIDVGRNRLLVTGAVIFMVYLVIAGRLIDLSVLNPPQEPQVAATNSTAPATDAHRTPIGGRANIVDRNGFVLATSLPTVSLYANPRDILDTREAATKLLQVLPELDRRRLQSRLTGKGTFAWIKRNLTPKQQYKINRLGLPGINFRRAAIRVYPHGTEASHILGLTDIDNRGIAGIEKTFDEQLKSDSHHLTLTIDIRVQSILHAEIAQAMTEFRASGAAGIVLDVANSEVLAMASLPSFDPNALENATPNAIFNRATKGVYEMGSTFKLFTTAMALDSGVVRLTDGYDASKPIHIGRFIISDFHGKNRWLSVPEILIYSSNIGTAKMAIDVGGKAQQAYLGKLGLLSPVAVELPEVGTPLKPFVWRDINTMTIGYGHGIAVTPLQVAAAVGALVNGGIYYQPTLIRRGSDALLRGERVFSARTSRQMRSLMRDAVTKGTGANAKVAEYPVGGKTGTAEKLKGGAYQRRVLISSFVAAFPIDKPRYVVLVLIDEPRGNKKTFGYATAGWVAAPAAGRIMRRVGAMMGLAPNPSFKPAVPANPLLVKAAHDQRRTWEKALAPD